MTVIAKTALLKNLGATELLNSDQTGPFVGLHLGVPGVVHLRRTSDRGFIETLDAPDEADPGWLFASLPNLKENLRVLETETVDLLKMTSGTLMLRSVNSVFDTELRVYTVAKHHSGFKQHFTGPVVQQADASWLKGLNVRPFSLVMPPVVQGTLLLLATTGGTLVWDTGVDPGLPSSPKDTFLRALAGVPSGPFLLTDLGFFVVQVDGLTFCISGHTATFPQQVPSRIGAVKLTEIPAKRFGQALRAAGALAAEGAHVTLAPRHGVVTRNAYNQPVRFGLGELDPFLPFDLSQRSAKLLADVQDQTEGDQVTLYRAASAHDLLLFSLGNCLVQIRGGTSTLPA